MGTLIILTIICKLLGKDIKWAQRQLRRLWSAITRPFRGGDRAQNDTPRAMSRSVKIYLITALVSLTLLAAYVLFFVVGNRVINHRLESDFYGVACSELQMDLPEFVVVAKEGEQLGYDYYDSFVCYHIKFAEPLPDKTLELLESRCGDEAECGWKYDQWSDNYGHYYYNYQQHNRLWSYFSFYSISKEQMFARYYFHDYTFVPTTAFIIYCFALLLWGAVLLVMHIVRRRKNRGENLQ